MAEAEDNRTESQKRIDALIEEQRAIAEANRERARLEQEKFGWGDKG